MSTRNPGASAPAQPAAPSRWHSFLQHPHVHLGAHTCSIVMGFALFIWIWETFWVGSGAPSMLTVAWVIAIYMTFEPITAALAVVRKDRIMAPLMDVTMAVILVILTVVVLYDRSRLATTEARWDLALLFFVVAAGSLINSIVITLIVNTRVIGSVPVAQS